MIFLIILLSIYAVLITIIAYIGHKKAGIWFQKAQMLIAENGRFSNALREKGIEVDQLRKQVKRLRKNKDE